MASKRPKATAQGYGRYCHKDRYELGCHINDQGCRILIVKKVYAHTRLLNSIEIGSPDEGPLNKPAPIYKTADRRRTVLRLSIRKDQTEKFVGLLLGERNA